MKRAPIGDRMVQHHKTPKTYFIPINILRSPFPLSNKLQESKWQIEQSHSSLLVQFNCMKFISENLIHNRISYLCTYTVNLHPARRKLYNPSLLVPPIFSALALTIAQFNRKETVNIIYLPLLVHKIQQIKGIYI